MIRAKRPWTFRVSASTSGVPSPASGTVSKRPTRYGSSETRSASRTRSRPWTRIRSVPSGTCSILWTIATVPISWMSSQPGVSIDGSRVGHEREHALAGDDVVDQPDRALLPDRERGRHLREDDHLLQRQHRQRRRQVELAVGEVEVVEVELGHAALDGDRDPAARRRRLGDRQRDREDPALVLGARAARVDVLRQPHLPLERAVLDLGLLVDAAVGPRAHALAGDDEDALADDDADARGIDARELDDDGQLVRLVRVEAVDVRPEARARAEEPRHAATDRRRARRSPPAAGRCLARGIARTSLSRGARLGP